MLLLTHLHDFSSQVTLVGAHRLDHIDEIIKLEHAAPAEEYTNTSHYTAYPLPERSTSLIISFASFLEMAKPKAEEHRKVVSISSSNTKLQITQCVTMMRIEIERKHQKGRSVRAHDSFLTS